NHERLPARRTMNRLALKVVNRRPSGKDHTGANHRPSTDDGAFVHAAIPADHYVVFHDDRRCIHRLQHTAELGRGAQVDSFANLRAGTYQCMRVDHGTGTDVRTNIDVHRRHAHHSTREMSTTPDAGTTGDDAN